MLQPCFFWSFFNAIIFSKAASWCEGIMLILISPDIDTAKLIGYLYFRESSLQFSSLYSQVQSVAYYEYLFSVKLQDCLFYFVILPVHHTLHVALIWRWEFRYFSKVMPSWLIWLTGIFLMLMQEQHRWDKRQKMENKWWGIFLMWHIQWKCTQHTWHLLSPWS